MKYDEFKEMCHKAWSERYNYLCIDMTKNKNDGKVKPHILIVFLKLNLFKKNIQVHLNVLCKQIHSHSFK